ncbi:hypothetical protein AAC387_Pa03g2719 [Persea americana]
MAGDELLMASKDGAGTEETTELNRELEDDLKDVRDNVMEEGHPLLEEDELRINDLAGDMNGHPEVVVRAVAGVEKQPPPPTQQQQNPPGPLVQWERFLPLRSLKVLLVENDDSTRQVVSALLRNCSYEVLTAANGFQAWKILEDAMNHIDLVLTEVVMPCLSGIGLLCNIMNHKTLKNIPVIMMSSHDSMGIVFSCLSKGAVDFLVKPIRKNELKNLWQHIWRRCHSSSGSGSVSGIQTQKSAKLKSGNDTDNNTGSNGEEENGSIGLNFRDGSDNGSGTQSSWTKRAIEVDSPQPTSPWDQLTNPHDSTCAQVVHPKPETFCKEWMSMTTKECQEQMGQFHDNVEMGRDLEIGVPGNSDFQLKSIVKVVASARVTGAKQEKLPLQDAQRNSQPNEELLKIEINNQFSEWRTQASDVISAVNGSLSPQMENGVTETPNNASKISETKEKATLGTLELSLKRLRSVGDVRATHVERNVLRHSNMSAFSRYNTAAATTQATTGLGRSNSFPVDNSSEAVKMETVYDMPSISNVTPLNQGSNESTNNNNAFTRPTAFEDKSAPESAVKGVHPRSAFQPVQQSGAGPPQQMMHENVSDTAVSAVGKSNGSQHQVQVQHHHHHYHHHHHHIHRMQQPPPEDDDLSLKDVAAAATQCGSSNGSGGPMEGNDGNYSLNGSGSGSNHGSNEHNGSSTAVRIGGMNMENNHEVAGQSGAAGGSGTGSGSGVDQNRVAQRVAALTKFRQKRKERCFKKKVRYQSRKMLAEQRPRIKGQFVRQNVSEHTSQNAD